MLRLQDQLGRSLFLTSVPQRIVSLVPSLTELVVDLGGRAQLVGCTKFCVHPKNLRKEIAVVGGTKNIRVERIKALQPDLIICNKEENTHEIVAACEQIAPVYVSDVATVPQMYTLIGDLGTLVTKQKAAESLIKNTQDIVTGLKRLTSGKRVVYLIWKNPYMAAGSDTFIHTLLQTCGLENAVLTHRYPEITLEQCAGADVILLSSEPFPFKETDVKEIQGKTGIPVLLVDGEVFSWYGSRLSKSEAYLNGLLREIQEL